MGILKQFFDWIQNIITTLWDFVTSFFDNMALLVKYIGSAVTLAYSAIATMPSWLQVFGFITIAVSVIYLILGRTGGKSD